MVQGPIAPPPDADAAPAGRGLRAALREEALAQTGAAVLWLVAAFAAGVAAFFAWPVEPWPGLGPTAAAGAAAVLIVRRRLDLVAAGLLAVLAAGLGHTAAQVRVATVAAPALLREVGPLDVTGRVAEVQREPGRIRVILDDVRFAAADSGRVPDKVRLSLPARHGAPRVGDIIAVRAVLRPPERPVVPGGFEYQRYLFFAGIGALGYTLEPWTRRDVPARGGLRELRDGIENLRRGIADRILQTVPGDAGAVAVALVTGEQSLISERVQEDYRVSGLAHLLSISGLHMSLLAAAVFLLVRRGLALWPALAVRVDLKKLAAWTALAATTFYLLISGASVPAVRAFLMVAVAIVAILVDRRAVSLRSVALAALTVLALFPEAIVGASFQMSFMAVIALVALYERVALHPFWRGPEGEWRIGRALMMYVAALIVTDLVAGSVTSLFAAYHFNRVPSYSVVANLVATPVTGLWIMPMGLAALALMPAGLDAPFLGAMGAGVEAINGVAAAVARWPGAQVHVPPMATWALACGVAGLLLVCLWRGRLCWLGVVPLLPALVQPWLAAAPDVVVDESGRVVALSDAEGRMVLSPERRDRFVRTVIVERYGASSGRWPPPDVACDAAGCVLERRATALTIAFGAEAVADDCGRADVVLAPRLFDMSCPGSRLIDRGDLYRRGAHALYLGGGRVRVETVEDFTGRRAWSRRPVPRRRGDDAPRSEDAVDAAGQ